MADSASCAGRHSKARLVRPEAEGDIRCGMDHQQVP
jgi:hypothetical protein